jgi:hypothetical protein
MKLSNLTWVRGSIMADKFYTAKEAAIAVLKRAQELYSASTLAKSEDLKKGDWAKIHSKLKREGYSEESADKIDGAIKAKMGKGETGHEKGVALAMPKQDKLTGKTHLNSGTSLEGRNIRMANKLGGDPSAAIGAAKKASIGRMMENSKIKPNLGKSDEMGVNPDAAADAQLGEKVEQDVQEHEQNNEDPAHKMKGHIKLAKFMGRMDHKKEQSAKMQKDAPTLGATIGFPGAAATAPSPTPTATPSPTMGKSESSFDKLKNKIENKEGYSEKGAAGAAYEAGKAKYGKAGMAAKATAGRKKK